MTKSVLVVGGGLIGLSTALALIDRGASVTVLDEGVLGGGAARGNAGFLCPTLLEPLAAPGVLRTAVTSLGDPTRALRVRGRALPSMVGWGLHFARSATRRRHAAGREELARLNARHVEALERLGALGVDITLGPELVVPFHDPAIAELHLAALAPMADHGVKVPTALLDADELRRIVPALTDHVRAGYVLSDDHSIDPRVFVDSAIAVLRGRGADIVEHSPIRSVAVRGGRVASVATERGILVADEIVLAAGAGSRQLGRRFGLRLPVIAGQGYNIALPVTDRLRNPVIFEEAHVVATPFADQIRLGGTMEFAGDQPRFDPRRIDAILAATRRFLDLDYGSASDAWAGSRPMSPDGLPLLGRPDSLANLTVAAGHGMYGLTLAPVTALAISELIVDGRSSVGLDAFSPDRFSLRNLARRRSRLM